MAAKEIVNSHQTNVESIVNRWLVDYYLFLSMELFKNEQYSDFCDIRDVLQHVLARPFESTDITSIKLRVMQFICRINEGERLDVSFDSDETVTPLESALMLLESMNQEYNLPQQDFENVCTSVKEMIVGIFIKNNEFDKAKEVLNKHFPKPMVGKKAIFMGLISQKSKMHDVIKQIDFKRFKEEMYAFCQRICPLTVPFLHKAAKQLIDKRLIGENDKAAKPDDHDETVAESDDHDEPDPSSGPQINTILKHTVIQKTRLEAAYKALVAGSDEKTFAQLEEEVESEERLKTKKELSSQDSEQDGLFQRDPGSPMEASPADKQPQTDVVPPTQAGSRSKTTIMLRKQPYTVARLVVEPDSQRSLPCSTTSQEQEIEVTTEQTGQALNIFNKKDLQSSVTDSKVTTSTRKRPRQDNKTYIGASSTLADSEEEPSRSVAIGEASAQKLQNQTDSSQSKNTASKRLSSDSEEDEESSFKSRLQRPCKKLSSDPPIRDTCSTDDICITDSSLDSWPNLFPIRPVPQTSSTPQKDPAQDAGPSHSKWKRLFKTAKESKETWSEEETLFKKNSGSPNETSISNSGQRKKWTEDETQKLRDGVKKFGEGNWSKIKAYYSLQDRTNVNLKDRWRTIKKSNLT
ncbi:hypothetical protein PAMA_000294 [Pampus argenteus]